MSITAVRDIVVPVSSPIRNARIHFSTMKAFVVGADNSPVVHGRVRIHDAPGIGFELKNAPCAILEPHTE